MESLKSNSNIFLPSKLRELSKVLALSIFLCLGADKGDAKTTKCACDPITENNLCIPTFREYGFLLDLFNFEKDNCAMLSSHSIALDSSKLQGIDTNKITKAYNEYLLNLSQKKEKLGFIYFVEEWQTIGKQNGLNSDQIVAVFNQYVGGNFIPLAQISFLNDMKNFYKDKFDAKIFEFISTLDQSQTVSTIEIQTVFGDFISDYRENQQNLEIKMIAGFFTVAFLSIILLFIKNHLAIKKADENEKRLSEGKIILKRGGVSGSQIFDEGDVLPVGPKGHPKHRTNVTPLTAKPVGAATADDDFLNLSLDTRAKNAANE